MTIKVELPLGIQKLHVYDARVLALMENRSSTLKNILSCEQEFLAMHRGRLSHTYAGDRRTSKHKDVIA